MKADVTYNFPEGTADILHPTIIAQPPTATPTHPLSYNQQGIWAWQQLMPESTAYNVAFTLHICSPVNVRVLRRAIQQVVERHPTLHSVYQDGDGQPRQLIDTAHKVDFAVIDATGQSADQLESSLRETLNQPFDLTQQVVCARLYVLDATHSVLQVVMHHIAADGWSGAIVVDEISQLYGALLQDQAATLPPVHHGYDEFVAWQQELLASEAGQKMQQFWHEQLAGEHAQLDLPGDRPEVGGANYVPARYVFHIDEQLTEALRQLAKA